MSMIRIKAFLPAWNLKLQSKPIPLALYLVPVYFSVQEFMQEFEAVDPRVNMCIRRCGQQDEVR